MSDFEFLSSTTIGEYLPTGSIIHRVEPRAKLTAFGVLIIAITFTISPVGVALSLAVVLTGLAAARIPFKYALKSLWTPLPFLLFIALLQVFLTPGSTSTPLVSWWIFHITSEGILSGVLIILRFSALILTISLMTCCISTSEMIQGLQRLLSPINRIGIPTMDFVMVVQVTLRFLPFLAQSAERIAKAQASRGAEWGVKSRGLVARAKQVIPLIIPLFTISLRRAETMAMAMDARGYGVNKNRTSLMEFTFGWRDALFVFIAAVCAALIVLS